MPKPDKAVFCAYCVSSQEMNWRKIDARWRMVDLAGNVHACQGYVKELRKRAMREEEHKIAVKTEVEKYRRECGYI